MIRVVGAIARALEIDQEAVVWQRLWSDQSHAVSSGIPQSGPFVSSFLRILASQYAYNGVLAP